MFERSNERLGCMVVLTRTHHYLLKSVHSIPNIVQYCCPTVLEETLANILNKVKPDPTSSKISQHFQTIQTDLMMVHPKLLYDIGMLFVCYVNK
jgi:hypothetical protein